MKRTSQGTAIEYPGYLLHVSPIKKSEGKGILYFDGVFQTGRNETARFVSFSPEKLGSFEAALPMKKAVVLTNPRMTPNKGKTEITVGKTSKLEMYARKLNFEMLDYKSTESPARKVSELTTPGLPCTLFVKVVDFVDEERPIDTKYGPRVLHTALIADGTGSIILPLWGQSVQKLQKNKSYCIKNLYTKMFGGVLQVGTTSETSFEPIQDLAAVIAVENVVEAKQVTGNVQSVQVISIKKCLQCYRPVTLDDGQAATIRCSHCNSKQKVSALKGRKMAKIQIEDSCGKVHKLSVPTEVLARFLVQNALQTATDDEVEDFILEKEFFTVKHDMNTDFAISLIVEDTTPLVSTLPVSMALSPLKEGNRTSSTVAKKPDSDDDDNLST